MKERGRCPKCDSTELLIVEEARVPNYEFSNSVEPLTLTAHYTTTGESGFLGSTKRKRLGVTMEAWVCASCAFIEWYAKDLAVLERFAREREGGVRRAQER